MDDHVDEVALASKAAALKAQLKKIFGVETEFDPLWETLRNKKNNLEKNVYIMKRTGTNSTYHCIYCPWHRVGTSTILATHFQV